MDLDSLLEGVETLSVAGDRDIEISDICYDSRQVTGGSVFVASRGEKVDGHEYIDQSIEAGCAVVVAEELPKAGAEGVAWVHVARSRVAMAAMAANFYGRPSQGMAVAGVTGTNGKTT
ncbi:MAG: Mur ligase domain-containing protein, partial [Verrucomicrobiales bacterium]|nr:Mur ligase domain-containing protein [Verrucomicrobiales bacterium]